MDSAIQLPDVAGILQAIELELSEENRALISGDLTHRAFTLGVAVTLMQFYSDTDSQQVIGKYMLKSVVATMLK